MLNKNCSESFHEHSKNEFSILLRKSNLFLEAFLQFVLPLWVEPLARKDRESEAPGRQRLSLPKPTSEIMN